MDVEDVNSHVNSGVGVKMEGLWQGIHPGVHRQVAPANGTRRFVQLLGRGGEGCLMGIQGLES